MIDILDKRVLDSHDYDDIKSVLYRGVLDKDVLNNPFRKKPKKNDIIGTHYFNMNGVKTDYTEPAEVNRIKIALTKSKKESDIRECIEKKRVMNLPSDELVNKVENLYITTIKKEIEAGYVVATDGTISDLIEGSTYQVNLDNGYKSLKEKGKQPAFDIHIHPIVTTTEKDENGLMIKKVGDALPSKADEDDAKEKEAKYHNTEPCWVLGFFGYYLICESYTETRINFYYPNWIYEKVKKKYLAKCRVDTENSTTWHSSETSSNQGISFEKFKETVNKIMKEARKLKITLLIFLLLFSGMAVSAQCPSYDTYKSKILQTFYDDFKSILDKGGAVKLIEITDFSRIRNDYHYEPKFALIQAVKKNDNTILYKECRTPNLEKNGVTIDSNNKCKVTVDKNAKMPDYKTFEYEPYSVEIPLDAYIEHNIFFNCILKDCRGRIRIISDRMKYDTKRKLPCLNYTNYNMNMFEYMNKINKIINRYKNYSYNEEFSKRLLKEIMTCGYCFDVEKDREEMFDIDSRWGIRAFGNILVVIENADEDDMEHFIRIAKSVKRISIDEFDIHDIPNYIDEYDFLNKLFPVK